MTDPRAPSYYLFSSSTAGVAAATDLDLEVLKQCAATQYAADEQGYADWVIRDGKSIDSTVVATRAELPA